MNSRIQITLFAPANTVAKFNIVVSYVLLRHVNTSLLLLGNSIQHLSGYNNTVKTTLPAFNEAGFFYDKHGFESIFR